MSARDARSATGVPVDELTSARIASGELGADDVRVDPATLLRQADVADAHGFDRLGENLRRGAELTAIGDDELLEIYERLRPGRATGEQLDDLAASLEARAAARTAALVREARAAYARRGLLASG